MRFETQRFERPALSPADIPLLLNAEINKTPEEQLNSTTRTGGMMSTARVRFLHQIIYNYTSILQSGQYSQLHFSQFLCVQIPKTFTKTPVLSLALPLYLGSSYSFTIA